jgi:hypothetical protein
MHRWSFRAVVLTVALGLAAPWAVEPANAAPAWAGQVMPVVPNSDSTSLKSVDCPSATVCTAVGAAKKGTVSVLLAERWNGSGWAGQTAAKPAGANPRFEGVSCVAANPCFAVGYHSVNGTGKPLSEKWNGTSWVIKAMQNPTSASVIDVSCTAGNACTAVGSFWNGTKTVPLAQRWNGTAWAQQTVPNPAGPQAGLRSVSCATTSFCVAVGGAGGTPLIARWNGTAWALQTAPVPAGTESAELEGVSCTSASACTAVGAWTGAGLYKTLALRWNGSSWVAQTPANLPGTEFNQFYDVSCPTATACMAVGYSHDDDNDRRTTMTQRWNGTSWLITGTPTYPSEVDAELRGVDCSAAALCTAVGFSRVGTGPTRQLALRYS